MVGAGTCTYADIVYSWKWGAGFASGRKHPVTVIAFQSGRCGGMFQPGPLRNLHGSGGQMAYKMVDLKHFHI